MEQSQSDIPRELDVTTEDEDNAVLYNALKKEMPAEVVRLCQQRHIYRDGPMHVLTIHGDTVLHMAAYTMQAELVIQLLDMILPDERHKLIRQNAVGNTILHEATAFNKLVSAAQKMLEMAPQLLSMINNFEETAIFRAACYGTMEMFTFLDGEARERFYSEEDRKITLYQKPNDNSTILHTAVISGHFKLALKIVKKYDFLVDERDDDGMTALQHLARNSSAFKLRKAGWLKCFIYKYVISEGSDPAYIGEGQVARGWRVPLWEEIQEEKQRYKLAKELAQFLVKKDITSWKKTNPVRGEPPSAPIETNPETQLFLATTAAPIKKQKSLESIPLFLATKAGCVDIVEYILQLYPQAVEYVDGDGCTLLHIAIKYRQIEIFNMVEREQSFIRKLIQKIDKEGNSILHMVAEKAEYKIEQLKLKEKKDNNSDFNQGKDGDDKKVHPALEETKENLVHLRDDLHLFEQLCNDKKDRHTLKEAKENLVLQLQEDLLLFERVKKICPQHFFNNVNSKGKTAEQLFALKSEKLHEKATDWLKRTSENCSLVAVLIATVAFAAAYTVPGGYQTEQPEAANDQKGVPILLNKPLFVIFTITDVLSLTCTLTSLVIFLSILTSSFRLRDFKTSLPRKLVLGLTFLLMSVSMMMMAFAATVALMIHNKEEWTKIALYTVAFLPVTVFVSSFMPLYLDSLKTFNYIIQKIEPAFPRYSGLSSTPNKNCHVYYRVPSCFSSLPRTQSSV